MTTQRIKTFAAFLTGAMAGVVGFYYLGPDLAPAKYRNLNRQELLSAHATAMAESLIDTLPRDAVFLFQGKTEKSQHVPEWGDPFWDDLLTEKRSQFDKIANDHARYLVEQLDQSLREEDISFGLVAMDIANRLKQSATSSSDRDWEEKQKENEKLLLVVREYYQAKKPPAKMGAPVPSASLDSLPKPH